MDELVNLLPPVQPKNAFTQPLARTIDLYLSGEIKDPSEYIDWFNILNTANESDIIFLHINSPGGYLNTTIQLRESLINCSAHTIASVEGECCSGATVLFLSCKETRISKNSMFMIHSYTGGSFGKAHEIYSHIDFDKKWFKNLYTDVYAGFLTDEEIDDVINGKDFWFDADETYKRLLNYKKKYEKKEDEPKTPKEKVIKKIVNKKKKEKK